MSRPWNAWWDFRHLPDETMRVIVQTDHPKDTADFIAQFSGDEAGISQAERLIADIKAGRRDLMKLIREAKETTSNA